MAKQVQTLTRDAIQYETKRHYAKMWNSHTRRLEDYQVYTLFLTFSYFLTSYKDINYEITLMKVWEIYSCDFNTHTGRPAALMCSESRVCSQLYSSIVRCVSGWWCWWSGLVRSELDSGVLQCLCTRCSSLLGLHHCCISESLNDPPELNQLGLYEQMCF